VVQLADVPSQGRQNAVTTGQDELLSVKFGAEPPGGARRDAALRFTVRRRHMQGQSDSARLSLSSAPPSTESPAHIALDTTWAYRLDLHV
jgi:hypothetical protein